MHHDANNFAKAPFALLAAASVGVDVGFTDISSLVIRASPVDVTLTKSIASRSSDRVQLEVPDSPTGQSEELSERIFEDESTASSGGSPEQKSDVELFKDESYVQTSSDIFVNTECGSSEEHSQAVGRRYKTHSRGGFGGRKILAVASILRDVWGKSNKGWMCNGVDENALRDEFKYHFRNISRIMDCVDCEQCRGKVQTAGVATAMKILFEFQDESAEDLQAASQFREMRSENRPLFLDLTTNSSSVGAIYQHCRDSAAGCVEGIALLWRKSLEWTLKCRRNIQTTTMLLPASIPERRLERRVRCLTSHKAPNGLEPISGSHLALNAHGPHVLHHQSLNLLAFNVQHMPKPNLRLEDHYEPEEVDVGDLGTGATIFSLSSSSYSSSPSPRTPKKGFALPALKRHISRKPSLDQLPLPSPSSPDLSKTSFKWDRPGLTRSATLPKVQHSESRSDTLASELEALQVESGVLEKIRRWILGIAVVTFDIDQGPVVDGIFPPLVLFPKELENVAFSAFPDSLQFDQGSQVHSFRIRGEKIGVSSGKRPANADEFIYGFSHFTQKRDPTSKRGYEQTIHALNLRSLKERPDPTPGTLLEIGFLGTVLHVELPHLGDGAQQLTETKHFKGNHNPKLHILASAPPFYPPPILLFEACLSHLWSIWECVVLCEPILLFGSSPAQTSQAAWWLRDLLRPIPLAGDFRPYFTIHDKDHSVLVNKLPPKPGLILGVTNPYFDRSCTHWPHILSLGRYIPPNTATRTTTATATAGPQPGWTTRLHKRYISKDRALLKQLEDACRGSEQQKIDASLALRLHFYSRTNELLIPLTRYLHTLIPTPTQVAQQGQQRGQKGGIAGGGGEKLRLKPFNSVNFFVSLKAHGSTLPFRSSGKRKEFYERWLKTPAFGLWLAQQESIVQDVLDDNLARKTLLGMAKGSLLVADSEAKFGARDIRSLILAPLPQI
ncbi:hypothetical protein D9757_001611 [Collybiopsis confluens]|uniref:UDENN domain-containing protein n=1 Tax=Collybiopsis confluens TaxID=2823264 RepID=A0A8H5I035_9AGAR|nr:hypothetical protein D9757_001611 [Collybiopsis confluens]